MLTVMYRDQDGNETINEARSVHKDIGSLECPHGSVTTVLANGDRVFASFGDPSKIVPDQKSAEIFVMNEAGKTVATYRL